MRESHVAILAAPPVARHRQLVAVARAGILCGPAARAAQDPPAHAVPRLSLRPQRFEVRPGIAMSYLDEGPKDGEVVLMLHGNPSWSFYWRHLVNGLKDRYRCIVPTTSAWVCRIVRTMRLRHRQITTTRCSRGSMTSMRCCDTSVSTARLPSQCTTGAG
jgi:hypothetical protein